MLINTVLILALLILGIGVVGIVPTIVNRQQAHKRKNEIILQEDILKRLYQREQRSQAGTIESLAGSLNAPLAAVARAIEQLTAQGLVKLEPNQLQLNPQGHQLASRLVRGHRVLETYLAENTGHSLEDLHQLADQQEHQLQHAQIEAMSRSLGYPRHDPHGDPIPDIGSPPQQEDGLALNSFPAGSVVKITHIEDEPDVLFQHVITQGLVRGSELEVIANEANQLSLKLAGHSPITLSSLAASQIDAVPSSYDSSSLSNMCRLDEVALGQSAVIVLLSAALRGIERRRLLDLGFTPGAEVTPALRNALGGDPVAYLIRHSKIALRAEQAAKILVAPRDSHEVAL